MFKLFLILGVLLCADLAVAQQAIRVTSPAQHPLRHRLSEVLTNCNTSDAYCFKWDGTQLSLYINGTIEEQWPAVVNNSFLLMEDGSSFILLEDSGKIILN